MRFWLSFSALALLVFCSLPVVAQSQVAYARLKNPLELEQSRMFYSLEEAMVAPDQVVKLSLAKRKLKSFPLEILLMKNLQVLNLAGNRIDSLPAELRVLQNLQEVNLTGNALTSLPREIGDLRNLQKLYLSGNRLHKFPNEMRGLKKLRYLDLSYNSMLPFELEWIQRVLPDCTIRY